jgi:hypothetical protein
MITKAKEQISKSLLEIYDEVEKLTADKLALQKQQDELKEDLKECIMVLEVIPEEIVTQAMNHIKQALKE